MERIEHLPSPAGFDTGHDDPATYERNVENYVGTVPVGLAGPLLVEFFRSSTRLASASGAAHAGGTDRA